MTCALGLAGHPETARGGGRAAEDVGDPGREAGKGAERRNRYSPQIHAAGVGLGLESERSTNLAWQGGLRTVNTCRG